LIYAGRAGGQRPNGKLPTNTLWGRVGGMHLRGNRDFSTFRLTLTAALRHSGEAVDDEAALTRWMHRHLRVAARPVGRRGMERVSVGELLVVLHQPQHSRLSPRAAVILPVPRQAGRVSWRGVGLVHA
jgi:hypothetical protein